MKTSRSGASGGNVRVGTPDDLLIILDKLLERRDGAWWDTLFSERARTLPFVVGWPDESLVDDFAREILRAGRVLELGCGNGRNAIYLASRDCSVDAVDFSSVAIRWANDLARAAQQKVRFIHGSIFDLDREPAAYDIVYDSGCFHHVPPHRREGYVDLVSTVLKPGGILSMICFNPAGGSGLTD
ncbi:MAG: class I SAM-dependent methyltransferase, partial [Candidatus Eremiobacteraeota bacterium]|nr:class I SAM-dependent methyltransferase [Candidatus Eremiobacteraeota bacterium]